ncbi:hypothetical protein [Caulobacter sp. UNC279MFTsu5.1]|uniref:hypothetical protein n=1 Tax=Caulobacter sp. UNC279MFTsu5.1 TaxID=1502775 RepID=UPI0015A61379|nr:hypothetical protein [Caulobacter sp. UNC279MFTsu5.1]
MNLSRTAAVLAATLLLSATQAVADPLSPAGNAFISDIGEAKIMGAARVPGGYGVGEHRRQAPGAFASAERRLTAAGPRRRCFGGQVARTDLPITASSFRDLGRRSVAPLASDRDS